jgi:6-pyruvoyl-tetrahydropterin synthase related domain
MTSSSLTLSSKKSFVSRFSPETIHVLTLLGVAIVAVSPILFYGFPSALDLSNHFRFALPFYDALRSGHLYPGWLAESNNGFGDASFRFYPPALYYLLAATRALSGNWYAGTVATFASLSMIGALGMYLWAREFTSSQTAMWAGIFYAVAPYHVNQLFQAVMLAEFAGAAVLPFAFLFVERVCRYRRAKDIAGLAAAYALLVLTHLPLAVIGSLALMFYALLRIDRNAIWKTLSALTISVGLGLAASACYWTTMVFELNWIRGDNVNPDPGLDYRHNFVLSTFSSDAPSVWWMNILLLSIVVMSWPAFILIKRAVGERDGNDYRRNTVVKGIASLALLLSFTLFMATPLSRPIWNLFRPLQETQFPWRWLAITSLPSSLLLALSIPSWVPLAKTKRPLTLLAIGTIAISLTFSIRHIIRDARWLTPAQFEQTLANIPGSQGVYQWLPIWTHDPLPQMNASIEAGDRAIKIENWSPEKRLFLVSAGNATEARIKTFFYPHWTATAGDRQLSIYPDQSGAMIVALPKEATAIALEFREPKRVRFAAGLTFMGWMFIGGLFVKTRRRSHI